MRLVVTAVVVLLAGSGCTMLFPVKQDPFPIMEVKGTRPPPGPARVVLTASNIAIMDKVQFEKGSAELLAVSFPLLDEVAKMMKDNPQIELVQIEGHTDITGPADFNRKLSQQRAESVVKYISGKGVGGKRMDPKGFGPDRPIADNETDAGREANRRVEFNIVKQGPKKTVVKDE
jgi:OOP family OmpA-OmpF porin